MDILTDRPKIRPRTEPPVLITGCSSGIGLASALHLARRGFNVAATVKSLDEQGTLREDARREGLDIDIVPMDNTSEQSARDAFHYLEVRYGKLRALINNAGIGGGGFFEELGEDELRELFETNFFGTARVTRLAIPLLRAGAPSHLITITSMAGRIGVPAMSAYHSSKFALEGLCECLYYELAPHDVRVAVIEPGLIRTPILSAGFRLSRRFNDPASFYFARSQKIWTEFVKRFERTANPPDVVARALERILADPAPSLRHTVGADSTIILGLFRLLPQRLMSSLWRRLAG